MLKISQICLKNNIISGPMAGISNPAYRSICIENKAGLVVSEMISDKAICYRNKKTLEMLKVYENEHPIAIQLFGSDPITMAKAAKYIEENTNADILDINMGCPVNKVIKAGAGCKLMLDEELAYNIVKSVKNAIKLPITVKFRLGYDDEHINVVSFAKKMEEAGADAISIHARTRAMMYSGKAKWEYIKLVKEAVNIPVIGNGDIKTPEDAKRMLDETNCDGIMIARAAVGNPWIFQNIENYLENKPLFQPSLEDCKKMCYEHAKRLVEHEFSEHIAISQMRGIVGHYFVGFNGSSKIRERLNSVDSLEELKNILDSIEI